VTLPLMIAATMMIVFAVTHEEDDKLNPV